MSDPAEPGGRSPGLLVEWRTATRGWEARTVHAAVSDGQAVLHEAWLPADRVSPA